MGSLEDPELPELLLSRLKRMFGGPRFRVELPRTSASDNPAEDRNELP